MTGGNSDMDAFLSGAVCGLVFYLWGYYRGGMYAVKKYREMNEAAAKRSDR